MSINIQPDDHEQTKALRIAAIMEFRNENPATYTLVDHGKVDWDKLGSVPVINLANIGCAVVSRIDGDPDTVCRMPIEDYAELLHYVDATRQETRRADRGDLCISVVAEVA